MTHADETPVEDCPNVKELLTMVGILVMTIKDSTINGEATK